MGLWFGSRFSDSRVVSYWLINVEYSQSGALSLPDYLKSPEPAGSQSKHLRPDRDQLNIQDQQHKTQNHDAVFCPLHPPESLQPTANGGLLADMSDVWKSGHECPPIPQRRGKNSNHQRTPPVAVFNL